MDAGELSARRRALLVQALERHWPGCKAHTKRDAVVVSELLAPQVRHEIGMYIAGWRAGTDAVLRVLQDELPFSGVDHPAMTDRPGRATPAPQSTGRRRERSAAARAGLESLFALDRPEGG
jgi:hypothetical protein